MRDSTSRFASLRAFHYPAYVRIWAGAFVSNIGTWIQAISVGVYVTETTGQAGWTGTVAALAYAPTLFLAPLAGALADRFDRRRVILPLLGVQCAATVALALLAATGALSIPVLAALVFASGCASALSNPAFNALLSELVAPEDLLSAVSLTSAQFNLARTLGPALAALILTLGGITVAFAVNALSFAAVIGAAFSVETRRHGRARTGETLWQGFVGGLKVARSDPGIRLALPLTFAVATLIAPFIGLMPAYVMNGLGMGRAAASLMVMAQGVGALLAALAANAVAQRWGVERLLSRSLLAAAPIAAAYWLAPSYPIAFALLVLLGGAYLWTLVGLSTTCMGRVGRDLQARMNSLYALTLSGGYSIGLVAQGWLGDHFGLRAVPAAAALAMLAVALWLRRRGAYAAVGAPATHALEVRLVEE